MNAFVDKVGVVLVMAQADIPGQGIQPQAPPGLAGKMNTFLSWVQYFGIFFAVVGERLVWFRRCSAASRACSAAMAEGLAAAFSGCVSSVFLLGRRLLMRSAKMSCALLLRASADVGAASVSVLAALPFAVFRLPMLRTCIHYFHR